MKKKKSILFKIKNKKKIKIKKSIMSSQKQNKLNNLVIYGPSGVGKSTLIKKLLNKYPESFKLGISHTTRNPRDGETNGVEYYFVTISKFLEMKVKGAFLETTKFCDNYYAMSYKSIQEIESNGKICILDFNIQGLKFMKSQTTLSAKYIYIKPPTDNTLKERLKKRGGLNRYTLQLRITNSKKDMKCAESIDFDLIIINNDLEKAFDELLKGIKLLNPKFIYK